MITCWATANRFLPPEVNSFRTIHANPESSAWRPAFISSPPPTAIRRSDRSHYLPFAYTWYQISSKKQHWTKKTNETDIDANQTGRTEFDFGSRFPIVWLNDRQTNASMLVYIWMIYGRFENQLWWFERILGRKGQLNLECTFVVRRFLLQIRCAENGIWLYWNRVRFTMNRSNDANSFI